MHEVFISYSSKDSVIANAVCHILEELEIRCFIAPRDIAPGAIWAECLVSAIKQSKVFVLVFSSNANQSKQVYKEISIAVDAGLTIIPFIISPDKPEGVLEYYIADTHWIDALTPPVEGHIHRLAGRISILLKENKNPEIVESDMEDKTGEVQFMDHVDQTNEEDCLGCGFHHAMSHCPVCGTKKTDASRTVRQKRRWILLASVAWLILTGYSIIVTGAFLTMLYEEHDYVQWEYAALSVVAVSALTFCVLASLLCYRAIATDRVAKKSGKEIISRLKKKNIPLYRSAFYTGITLTLLQVAILLSYLSTI